MILLHSVRCINMLKKISLLSSLSAVLTVPVYAGVIVNSPSGGSQVGTPFNLSATASTCSSQSVATMGYSLDNSPDTSVVKGSSVDLPVTAGAGSHTLHVKAWGNDGSSCVTDVPITVSVSASESGSVPPSNATSVSSVQALSGWQAAHDDGGPGSSSGTMSLVNSPSHSGTAREFVTSFSGSGDERYSVSFDDDSSATNFLYDGWVYFKNSSAAIGNLEMDLNQVMSNGQNAIIAMQCAGYSGTWQYTKNKGTPDHPVVEWKSSTATCNPRSWSPDVWHHVQIQTSRDDSGNVTYHSVALDGAKQDINVTVPSAFALGWAPTLQTQFQVDGIGSGKATVYLDDLVVYRW
ncbi:MAG: hypothetical protein ABSF28_18500 [Terracidiphilus sp.]|jgi:hypothetical protein